MKRKILNVISILLIVSGIGIIGGTLYLRYKVENKNKTMVKQFEERVKESRNKNSKNEDNNKVDSRDAKKKELSLSEGTIGIIQIPKIDLTVAIGEGVKKELLRYAVGHFPETVMPGEKGNCALAGHSSYVYNEFFNGLEENIANGDKILIKTMQGDFEYKVYDKFVVEPERVEVLNPSEESILTLVTCTEKGKRRLIVKAKLLVPGTSRNK